MSNALTLYTRCWIACEYSVLFLVFGFDTMLLMSKIWTYRFTLTHNTELYQLAVYTRTYQQLKTYHIWNSLRWNVWRSLSTAIHNPMRVMEWSNRLRYSWFCIRSSARSDLLLVSHEALLTMQQTTDDFCFCFCCCLFLHFFFLIKNTV